jgi:phosphoenolpyruvate phosphomutase
MSLKDRTLPEKRRGKLKKLLSERKGLHIMEAHNGLSALVASEVSIERQGGETLEFDGLWLSSLTDSASKGHPDTEVIGVDSRLMTIQEVLNVTNKPVIVDGDTGGEALHFEYLCSKLEAMGVSAVIIEDKQYPKRNSLEPGATQLLELPSVFATKLKRGREVLLSDDFMIIARLESLIANRGVEDAIFRAREYLEAGVDGIMVHSKEKIPDEILSFFEHYESLCDELGYRRPVVCVPTTYNVMTDEQLFNEGANIVIHANHQLRAAHRAMEQACKTILQSDRSLEADAMCSTVRTIFKAVGFLDAKDKDARYDKSAMHAIIAAAGRPPASFIEAFGDIPVSELDVAGKTILQRQAETLNQVGISNLVAVTGYGRDRISYEEVQFVHNTNFRTGNSLHSVFCAETYMGSGFLFAYGDILFHERLARDLISVGEDMVLVIDSSLDAKGKKWMKPNVDLVVAAQDDSGARSLSVGPIPVSRIGSRISAGEVTHEFTGLAMFSERGAEILRTVYHEARRRYAAKPFHEAENFQSADMNDLLQEIINRGYPVFGIEVSRGWIEIRDMEDYESAQVMLTHGKPSTAEIRSVQPERVPS